MKKFLFSLLAVVVMLATAADATAAKPRKTGAKKKAATSKVYAPVNMDFKSVLQSNVGKKYNTQLMRNLMNSDEFVQRGGYEAFKPIVERLSGDVTSHQLNGREVLMLRFGDMRDPGLEQIVFWDAANDNFITTTCKDSETWGEIKSEKDTDINLEAAKKIYWSTFES